MQSAHHSAGIAVEAVFSLVVADSVHCVPHDFLYVHIGVIGTHFSAHNHQTSGAEGLAGHLCLGVLTQKFVQYRIRNLVGNLVRVSLGNRLGSK